MVLKCQQCEELQRALKFARIPNDRGIIDMQLVIKIQDQIEKHNEIVHVQDQREIDANAMYGS